MNRKDIRDKVIKIIEEEIYKVSKHTVSMGVEIRLFDRDSIKDFNKFVGYLDSRASRAMEPHFDDDSAIFIGVKLGGAIESRYSSKVIYTVISSKDIYHINYLRFYDKGYDTANYLQGDYIDEIEEICLSLLRKPVIYKTSDHTVSMEVDIRFFDSDSWNDFKKFANIGARAQGVSRGDSRWGHTIFIGVRYGNRTMYAASHASNRASTLGQYFNLYFNDRVFYNSSIKGDYIDEIEEICLSEMFRRGII